jgi:hypothetical protein
MSSLAWHLALFVPHTHDLQAHVALEQRVRELAQQFCARHALITTRTTLPAMTRLCALRMAGAAGLSGSWEICADLAESVLGASLLERRALVIAALAHSASLGHKNESRCRELLQYGRAAFAGWMPTALLAAAACGREARLGLGSVGGGGLNGASAVCAGAVLVELLTPLQALTRYVLGGQQLQGATVEAAVATGHSEAGWASTEDLAWRLAGYLNIAGRIALECGVVSAAVTAFAMLSELLASGFLQTTGSGGPEMVSAAWSLKGAIALSCGRPADEARAALQLAVAVNTDYAEPLALLGLVEIKEQLELRSGPKLSPRRDPANPPTSSMVQESSPRLCPDLEEATAVAGGSPAWSPQMARAGMSGRRESSQDLVGSPLAAGYSESSPVSAFDTAAADHALAAGDERSQTTSNSSSGSGAGGGCAAGIFFAQRALRCDRRCVLAYQCLGQGLFFAGDVSGAAAALKRAADLEAEAPLVPPYLLLPLLFSR